MKHLMKLNILVVGFSVFALSFGTGCTSDESPSVEEVSVVETTEITTTVKTTTVQTTTTEKVHYKLYSESEAKEIAKKYIKEGYKEYSPVVIGEIKLTNELEDSYAFDVTGHYWKSDKFGMNSEQRIFMTTVFVNFETGIAIGALL